MSLAEQQTALFAAATGGVSENPALMRIIRSARRIPAHERLEAYRANIRAAHLQALNRAYPVTREVLGHRYWRQLLESELPAYASTSPDLDSYGDFLPGLIGDAQTRREELAEFPYLWELATLEWAVHRAGYTTDDPTFDWDGFTSLTDEAQSRARLVPSSALALPRFRYPVDDLWRRHTGAAAGDLGEPGVFSCCVHREGRFGVTVSRLGQDEHSLLGQVSNIGLGGVLNARDDAATAAAAQRIFAWIERGWIVGFEVRPGHV